VSMFCRVRGQRSQPSRSRGHETQAHKAEGGTWETWEKQVAGDI
jgi:hypothetical protein